MENIGFVGLGTMGSRNVRNLLAGGYSPLVFDVAPKAIEALTADGATAARSVREVAERSDVMFTSLPDSPQVIDVATGKDGISDGAHEGLVVIDLSTVAPMTPQRLAPELAPLGVTWLDAPVSGGPAGAEAGTLTIMLGGDEAAVDRCRPILETIGKNIEYMGPSGMGATTKIVNQLAIGVQMLSMFEAFTVGVAAGIDASRLLQVLRTSSSRCWVMENLIPSVVLRNTFDDPWFALRLMHKDLRIALDTARALDVPVAGAALSEQMFAIAEGRGWGDLDHMAVIKLYADWAGIEEW